MAFCLKKIGKIIAIPLVALLLLGCKHHETNRPTFFRANKSKIDTLIISDDSTYAPFEFLTLNRNGEKVPAGILIEIWNLWSTRTGIPIKYNLTSFSDAIKNAENGQTDIVSGICSQYRQGVYKLIYSRPYTEVKVRPIIAKSHEVYFKSLDQGKFTFGICEGDVTNLIVEKDYRNLKIKSFPNYEAEINALLDKKIAGILIEEPIFKYTLFSNNQIEKLDDFVILDDKIPEPLSAGSSDSNIISLVNWGFNKIKPSEIEQIENKWIKRYEPNLFIKLVHDFTEWFKKNIALGILFLLGLFILVSNSIAFFLFLFYPHRLFKVESLIRKIPVLNIKYKKLEISISKIFVLEFFIFNQRTLKAVHRKYKNDFFNKAIDFLNQKKSDKYLTFPIYIGKESIGDVPMVDNHEIIKNKLADEISASTHASIMIVGAGGIGKTTLSIEIMKWIYFDPLFNKYLFMFIPVDFSGTEFNNEKEDFGEKTNGYIKRRFSLLFSFPISQNSYDYFFSKKLIVLVIDSFTEYSSVKKDKIISFVKNWRDSGNNIIITSRQNNYNFGNIIEIKPQLLTTAFLMNVIVNTIVTGKKKSVLTKEDRKRINDIFNLLNKITNDDGVTPLFCKLFSDVLFNSATIDFSESNPPGIYKYYELIFERYIGEIIGKEESIDRSETKKYTDNIIDFASFFAWRQISINNTYNLNNYLSDDDLADFPEYKQLLQYLSSPGSIVIENSDRYKFKFDPIAEILVSRYLYEKYIKLNDANLKKELNTDFDLKKKPQKLEYLNILENLNYYIDDQIRYLKNDNRSSFLKKKIEEFRNNLI